MKSFKEIAVPAFVLFAICLVATFLLAMTNSVTAPRIAALADDAEKSSRTEVLPDAVSFCGGKSLQYDGNDYTYFVGCDKDGGIVGFTFTTSAKGYGGDIVIMTGIDTFGKVTGITALELNETAGLGMKAQSESFRSRFIGKSGVIGVSTAGSGAENSVDAITGATITTKAVADAVNDALLQFEHIKEAGETG